jgi:hypothetical protein
MSLALSIISVRSVREYISHSSGLLEWSGCFGVRIEKKIDPASCRSTWHDRSGSTRWQRNWRSLENWDDFAPKHRTDRRNFVNRKISSNAMTMTVFKHSKQYRFARSPIINIYFMHHCSRVKKKFKWASVLWCFYWFPFRSMDRSSNENFTVPLLGGGDVFADLKMYRWYNRACKFSKLFFHVEQHCRGIFVLNLYRKRDRGKPMRLATFTLISSKRTVFSDSGRILGPSVQRSTL